MLTGIRASRRIYLLATAFPRCQQQQQQQVRSRHILLDHAFSKVPDPLPGPRRPSLPISEDDQEPAPPVLGHVPEYPHPIHSDEQLPPPPPDWNPRTQPPPQQSGAEPDRPDHPPSENEDKDEVPVEEMPAPDEEDELEDIRPVYRLVLPRRGGRMNCTAEPSS
ncbi:hypothetical protein DFS34DRAFT_626842 [Phlyctochytrium arcticum]|nr:hypothetical protein DFS34DRAFT_626842 [Phlyctochytrium arcticum]